MDNRILTLMICGGIMLLMYIAILALILADLWADGSGVNMESRNMVHKSITTSAIRMTYAPNYAQQIFDTTVNKLLICTDPANKTWVDANGNIVQ